MKFLGMRQVRIGIGLCVSYILFVNSLSGKPINKDSEYKVGVVDSLHKVFKFREKIPISDRANVYSAKNEYESFQILIYDVRKNLDNVVVDVSDLKSIDGKAKINSSFIKIKLVGYVPTKKPYYRTAYVGLWPDPLLEINKFNVNRGNRKVLWFSVYIPDNTPSGEYRGTIEIQPEGLPYKKIPLNLHVWNFTLPKTSHLKTAFDFYPQFISKFYTRRRGEDYLEWKGRINGLIESYYLSMLRYRISPILNLDPLSESFNARITKYLDYGISAFAIGKYGGTFGNNWPKNNDSGIVTLYRRYAQILRQKDILDKAYLYTWDEGKIGNPRVREITALIHQADPELKNMVCYHGFWDSDKDPEWGKDIDIWCFQIASYNERLKKKLETLGKEIWMYISGPDSTHPNFAIDFPAISARIIPWMCWKYNIKGLLYWCVNFWKVNPYESAMNTDWQQNGNGLLYYPGKDGPVASLRLELIRDGMEDYEYLYILSRLVNKAEKLKLSEVDKKIIIQAKELLNLNGLINSLSDYSKDPQQLLKRRRDIANMIEKLSGVINEKKVSKDKNGFVAVEDFSKPLSAESGKRFGKNGAFTFELYRGGTFVIDGASGYAWQKSDSYRDSAFIRSTDPLPNTYKITAVVGDIDYNLEKISSLVENDTEYKEGPKNENGVYLLAITDVVPIGHHTNDWWHQHRKVCIDVDNNIWGTGMPHPIFMVYFDNNNDLVSYSGRIERWQNKWRKAVTYELGKWYKVEIEKTSKEYIMHVYDDKDNLLKEGRVNIFDVWHGDSRYPDYFVIGDPHENYYQGSVKIKSISIISTKN
jgi:hypothetical protein